MLSLVGTRDNLFVRKSINMNDLIGATEAMNVMTETIRVDYGTRDAAGPIATRLPGGRAAPLSSGVEGERPSLIMQALQGLNDVAAAHSSWLKAWHVDVLAGLASGRSQTAEAPDLAGWIRVFSHQTLVTHASSRRAIDLLRKMQAAADDVAALARETGGMPPEAYGGFMSIALDFTTAVRDLQNETWKRLANVEPLTGLGNRQAMWRRLSIEADRHGRNGQPCSLAMIDLDNFKPINDSYGHAAGDMVLVSLAALLAASIRPYDSLFRFGGDEFLICLPSTDARAAWAIVERLRLKVAHHPIRIVAGIDVRTTLSIGIAPLAAVDGVDRSLDHADQALYVAKRNGRNGVYVWSEQDR